MRSNDPNDLPDTEIAEVNVTTMTAAGSGFGVRTDTHEGVYLSHTICQRALLHEGATTMAKMVPNPRGIGKGVAWKAIFADPVTTKSENLDYGKIGELKDRYISFFDTEEGPWRLTELYELVGSDADVYSNKRALEELYDAGKVHKGMVWSRKMCGDHTTFFAKNPEDLDPTVGWE